MVFDKRIIFRDVLLYIVAGVVTILFGVYGWITWWTSLILLGLYVVLVVVVVIDDAINPSVEVENAYTELEDNSLVSNPNKFRQLAGLGNSNKNNIQLSSFENVVKTVTLKFRTTQFIKNKMKFLKQKREKKQEEGAEHSLFDKISHYLDLPFVIVLWLTALPVVKEQYSRIRCIVYPIPGLFFAWYIFHPSIDYTYLFYPLPAGILLTILFAVILP